MTSNNDVKQEASLPVQSRIDIRALANLVMYWEDNDVRIKSMSQLLSWSIELVLHLLSINNRLPKVIESVAEANTFIREKGLYQPGLRRRGHAKLINAMSFENLRNEGQDPATYVAHQHSLVHNPHSVSHPEFDRNEAMNIYNKISSDMSRREIDKSVEEYRRNNKLDPITGTYTTPNNPVKDEVRAPTETTMPAVQTKPKKKKEDPMTPRARTKEEMEEFTLEFERKERIRNEKLRNM